MRKWKEKIQLWRWQSGNAPDFQSGGIVQHGFNSHPPDLEGINPFLIFLLVRFQNDW